MKRLMALARHATVLNLLLSAALVAFALFVIWPLFDYEVKVPAAPPKKAAEEKKEQAAEPAAVPPQQDYLVIAEQNLFHPERKIPPLKKEEAQVPKPEFVLYGTLITDNLSIAYLTDKKAVRSTPGRGKRQNSLKLGESLSGYTLREVHHDRIVMARGDDRMEIKVIAPGVKKDRAEGETAITTAAPPAAAAGKGKVTQAPPAPAPAPAAQGTGQYKPRTRPSTIGGKTFRPAFTPPPAK